MYDPTIGRFLSEDPTGLDGGDPNLYRYVGNDPINHTDPTGTTQAGNPLNGLFGGYAGNSVAPYKPINSFGASLPSAMPKVRSPVATPKYATSAVQSASVQPASDSGFFGKIANKVSSYLPWQSSPAGSLLTSFVLNQNAKTADAIVQGGVATGQHVRQVYDSGAAGEISQAARQHVAFTLGNASNSLVAQAVAGPGSAGLFQAAGPLSQTLNPASARLGQQSAAFTDFVALTTVGSAGRPKAQSSYRELPIVNNEPFYPNFKRVAQDVAVHPTAPAASGPVGSIGVNKVQYSELQADLATARRMEATDIRVNQQQVNASGVRVGTNRPDLQLRCPTNNAFM